MSVNILSSWHERAGSEVCLLCGSGEFALNEQLGFPAAESIVGSWKHWTVAVDLAPLSLGHLLARPKCHKNSIAECTDEERFELEEIINSIGTYVSKKGRKMIAYEHCDGYSSRRNCISHTHLHLLPILDSQETNLEILGLLGALNQVENTSQLNFRAVRNYIFVYYGNSRYFVTGSRLTDSIRDRLEMACAGQNAPWRTRLQDIEKCRQLVELSTAWYSDF